LFYGEEEKDPYKWVELFDHAADANNWVPERKVKIASSYLHGLAAHWYDDFKWAFDHWDNKKDPEGGLRPKIASWLSIANPATLDKAIIDAHKIEAGQNPAQPRPPIQDFHRPGNVNYCGLDEDKYEPEGELEAYITLTARHEPYPPPRLRGYPKKLESQVEERLKANLPVVEILVPVSAQENEYFLPIVEETSPSRIR
ncbi:2439_t:CDS:2, partial [Cetraspora pellucida]